MGSCEDITERVDDVFEIPTEPALGGPPERWASQVRDVLKGSRILESQGDVDDAIKLLTQAISLRPDEPAYLNRLGTLLARRGQHPEAIALLERATTVSPKNRLYAQNLEKVRRSAKSLPVSVRGWDPPTE